MSVCTRIAPTFRGLLGYLASFFPLSPSYLWSTMQEGFQAMKKGEAAKVVLEL